MSKIKIICVEDGSVDLDALERDGLQNGKVLVYRQGAKPPFILEIDKPRKKKKKTKIRFSFKSKTQLPLFMIIKEYYDEHGEIEFAKVLFEIQGRKCRKAMKELKERGER